MAASTTIHYRASASSDFTTITGPEKTFTTSALPPPPPTSHRPKSKIVGLPSKVKAKKLKSIHGTASDADGDLARVQVAVTATTGGARAAAAKPRCLRLTASGGLKSSKAVHKRCTPKFLSASGTTKNGFSSANRRVVKVT